MKKDQKTIQAKKTVDSKEVKPMFLTTFRNGQMCSMSDGANFGPVTSR